MLQRRGATEQQRKKNNQMEILDTKWMKDNKKQQQIIVEIQKSKRDFLQFKNCTVLMKMISAVQPV